jgi:hypothetical protein
VFVSKSAAIGAWSSGSKRMNEAPCNGLGEDLIASIKALCGHDHQGQLARIEGAASERFLT